MSAYLDALARGVVIFDGGAGTSLHAAELCPDDFGGPDLDGCVEMLNVTRPDVIEGLHRSFLDVGVDVVETNTFGGFAVPLNEYGIADRAYELSAAGASIASRTVNEYRARDGRRRFVAGSIGPGTKFATLGQITYRELRDSYEIQAAGLIDGGIDVFVIETQFDLLGAKAAINGARRAMRSAHVEIPIQVQVTIELTGRMLPGTEIGAALTTLDAMRVDVVGLNCATGPDEMYGAVRYLSDRSRMPMSVIPNAGLPRVVDGAVSYDLSARTLAEHLSRFVTEYGVRAVGGCCGTTPDHLAAVVDACRPLVPAEREVLHVPSVASIYNSTSIVQDTSFLIVGERTNANGSRAFRDAMLSGDVDRCVRIGEEQVGESAHLVDLCIDYVGRDGVGDMTAIAARFGSEVAVPIVLDSTEPAVMEAGLELLGGRSVLNSLNLEDGTGPGSRARRVLDLAREHGAAVVCLLIDEDGQARDVSWKMRVARRMYDLAVNEYGLEEADLIFDPLTFPLSTGADDLRGDARETMEAIRRLNEEFPASATVLGVSNVSFGLNPTVRKALNSVFLHECLDAGLDAAIIHAGRIEPLHLIADEQRRTCEDLIYDRREPGYDPLEALLAVFTDTVVEAETEDERSGWSVERRLAQRIIDGDRTGLHEDLDEGVASGHTPLGLVNDVLLSGMKTVGELFASGDMQLPFVLRSAETMKASVAYLEPMMEHSDSAARGSIVLATVAGDVHDIGKNLVDIILSNNGFKVHNLGIKVAVGELIEAYERTNADAIGMSGLLVKSTIIMRDNLDELIRHGMGDVPVLLGGAALTRSYVERDLRDRYPGPLYYGKNAFSGLDAMQQIAAGATAPVPASARFVAEGRNVDDTPAPLRAPSVALDAPVFKPPFLGSRTVRGIAIDDIAAYLNETALFRNQWQFRPETGETDGEFRIRLRRVLRDQLAKARSDDLLMPRVVYGYFPVNADGDDLVVWTDETRKTERTRFNFPRQQRDPWLCIADFFKPVDDNDCDYAAFHIVTMGERASQQAAALFEQNRYSDYLLLHGLGVEMAEALAEFWHRQIRDEWGFGDEDGPSLGGLFRQQYRGGRYSWGYPACPDLEDNERVASLLSAERIGVSVSAGTGYQYQPEQTTSALIAHHPQAKYFVARAAKDARDADEVPLE
ncbi:MAG: methionine synthase [Actinomycetota bacterium]|nr:methionine synthase [Actinomycetota bacterium]